MRVFFSRASPSNFLSRFVRWNRHANSKACSLYSVPSSPNTGTSASSTKTPAAAAHVAWYDLAHFFCEHWKQAPRFERQYMHRSSRRAFAMLAAFVMISLSSSVSIYVSGRYRAQIRWALRPSSVGRISAPGMSFGQRQHGGSLWALTRTLIFLVFFGSFSPTGRLRLRLGALTRMARPDWGVGAPTTDSSAFSSSSLASSLSVLSYSVDSPLCLRSIS